jgi:hypothetical protein
VFGGLKTEAPIAASDDDGLAGERGAGNGGDNAELRVDKFGDFHFEAELEEIAEEMKVELRRLMTEMKMQSNENENENET